MGGRGWEKAMNLSFPLKMAAWQRVQVLTAAVDMCQEWPASLDSLGGTVSQLATAILPQLEVISHPSPRLV